MAEERVQRRLAAILAADVVGYSRMMGADEAGTLKRLNALRSEILNPKVEEYGSRIVKTTGDGTLIEFRSAVDAVQHAVDVQQALSAQNADLPSDHRIEMRIGINLGDVIVQDDDVFGDGVNVAARLEGLAEPGGIVVSGKVHDEVRGKVGLEFRDLGPQTVKNIADPVPAFQIGAGVSAQGPLASEDMFRRPAVAVLPFENLSGDPEQEYFADGLTEDIITALSLWKSFPVIARNSTFAYKGTSLDIRRVGNELGARYVIEGSVRRAGTRLRVTAQLINAATGHHVWAERYDRDLVDIFDLQDELTQRIAATVAPELETAEARHVIAHPPRDLDAWDAVQRGFFKLHENTKEGILEARSLFERAIEIDPNYARAYVGLAFSHNREFIYGFAESVAESLRRCAEAANRAAMLDDTDFAAHVLLGIVSTWQRDHARAVSEGRRAVGLNPSDSFACSSIGIFLTLDGRPDEGIPWLDRALTLNPREPRIAIWQAFTARAHLTAKRYGDAVDWARHAIQRQPNIPDSHLILAASLGHLGDVSGAKAALERCEAVRPGYSTNTELWYPYAHETDSEHFLDGLCKAGWEG